MAEETATGPLVNRLLDGEIAAYLEYKLTPEAMTALVARLKDSVTRVGPSLVAAVLGEVAGVDAAGAGDALAAELKAVLVPLFRPQGG